MSKCFGRSLPNWILAERRVAPKRPHFHRKEDKDGQLTAAQIYLKLGEVSAESGRTSPTVIPRL